MIPSMKRADVTNVVSLTSKGVFSFSHVAV